MSQLDIEALVNSAQCPTRVESSVATRNQGLREGYKVSWDWWSAFHVTTSASKKSIRRFVITEKAPTRAFSWLKAATTAFTFKTLY